MTDQPIEHVPGQLAADIGSDHAANPPLPADELAGDDDSAPAPAPASEIPFDESYVTPDENEQAVLDDLVPDEPAAMPGVAAIEPATSSTDPDPETPAPDAD